MIRLRPRNPEDFNTEVTVVTEATTGSKDLTSMMAPVTTVTPVLKSFRERFTGTEARSKALRNNGWGPEPIHDADLLQ
jgi:hypothetical protein